MTAKAQREVHVVQHEQVQVPGPLGARAHQPQERGLMTWIKVIDRLIQQTQRRILCQQCSHLHAPAFTTGECGDAAVDKIGKPDGRQCRVRHLVVQRRF